MRHEVGAGGKDNNWVGVLGLDNWKSNGNIGEKVEREKKNIAVWK